MAVVGTMTSPSIITSIRTLCIVKDDSRLFLHLQRIVFDSDVRFFSGAGKITSGKIWRVTDLGIQQSSYLRIHDFCDKIAGAF